jgi:hypothetical protein
VTSLGKLVTTAGAAEALYQQKMDEVKEFLRIKDVPKVERRQILAYYDHYCEPNPASDKHF